MNDRDQKRNKAFKKNKLSARVLRLWELVCNLKSGKLEDICALHDSEVGAPDIGDGPYFALGTAASIRRFKLEWRRETLFGQKRKQSKKVFIF